MTEQHPITPPPELVEKWRDEAFDLVPDDENPCPCDIDDARDEHIAAQAARWGANQELEACVEWLGDAPVIYNDDGDLHPGSYLRDARRPKPPSLKEKALQMLSTIERDARYLPEITNSIRWAVEALDD